MNHVISLIIGVGLGYVGSTLFIFRDQIRRNRERRRMGDTSNVGKRPL